jgi:hypothetical protein
MMPTNIFDRLCNYFLDVGEVLKGQAKPSSVFPNASDKGWSRERVYAEFLRRHAPACCTVSFGGFVFDDNGNESKQLDVIVTFDIAPQFNFDNPDGTGKSFWPVEGTIAVASLKSSLNKKEIYDALENIASIPPVKPFEGRLIFGVTSKPGTHEDWPLKIVYAPNGCSVKTARQHVDEFYQANPAIPFGCRPNVIHVAGQYYLSRITEGITLHPGPTPAVGSFHALTSVPDLQALLYVIDELQSRASNAHRILYNYGDLWRNVTNAAASRLGLPSRTE